VEHDGRLNQPITPLSWPLLADWGPGRTALSSDATTGYNEYFFRLGLDRVPNYDIMLHMENKRQRRTPDQLIADAQARLDKLQAKQAETEAKTNPLLTPLLQEIKDVEKAELLARKGFSKGPQNFDSRIAKAEARIASIEDAKANAERVIAVSKARKATLRAALSTLTTDIASGKEIGEDDVFLALEA
jgi:predicted phage tail protein